MGFIADRQTVDDLNLLGKYRNDSVYSIFNQVRTRGGEQLLDAMFRQPLTDVEEINARAAVFRYFGKRAIGFPFSGMDFGVVENYLSGGGVGGLMNVGVNILRLRLMDAIGISRELGILKEGLAAARTFLQRAYRFFAGLDDQDPGNPYREQARKMRAIVEDKRLQPLLRESEADLLSLFDLIRHDHLLRQVLREEMRDLLAAVYHIDVCIAVSGVARARGFTYADARPKKENMVRISGLYHPGLKHAVANSLSLHQEQNVLFLTGANMAGKSTFMKSFGIAVYLAHMGFPVAAAAMDFSVKDGLFSSINVPDNLSLGYSHFYAEVLRVKAVATAVSQSRDLVVLFDELFKGTNVKDAYDATLAVTAAFAANRNCAFIISTHLIEVGETLRRQCANLQFVYLPTVMEGATPVYTYRLQEGITADRHGMQIIRNEGILEVIRGGRKVGVIS